MTEHQAVTTLREYLRIRTVHPNPNYGEAITFLKKQAARIGLPVAVYGSDDKPILVMTWKGKNPSLTSILLNSHMDVVPVYEDKWTYDPFAAHKTEDGKIYGRGTQDMKNVGIQYVEAIAELKKDGFEPLRTIHTIFVPDEEIGSALGMAAFVKTKEFKDLHVGVAIDESCASPVNFFMAFNDERSGWGLEVICEGATGHGSRIMKNTAAEKARIVIDEFLDRRAAEEAILEKKEMKDLELAHVTTINWTMVNGGVQHNVIPDNIKLTFDIRVSVDENHEEFESWIQSVIKKAGDGVTVNFLSKEDKCAASVTDNSSPFWSALNSAVKKHGIGVMPVACPGNTDARFLRRAGVQAFGFTALRNTKILLHDHDEYITEGAFLEGLKVIKEVIKAMSSVSDTNA